MSTLLVSFQILTENCELGSYLIQVDMKPHQVSTPGTNAQTCQNGKRSLNMKEAATSVRSVPLHIMEISQSTKKY